MSERLALHPETSRGDALVRLRRAFAARGLDTPDLDARVLLAHALGAGAAEIAARPEATLGPEAAERLAAFAQRRLAREPVGRILGRREFWGLSFALSPGTLEPRPDTETLVETALALVPDRGAPLRLLDLGTGSGCLLVSLLHELPRAFGVGLDRSPEALVTARGNAVRHGVGTRAALLAADWAAPLRPPLPARFDLIVSNPPYIASHEIAALAPEVQAHDPRKALDGGEDGLAAYRAIFAAAPPLLAPDGRLLVEIGSTQEEAVGALAGPAGLGLVRVARDLGGHPRVLTLEPRGPGHLAFGAGTPI